MLRAGFKTRKEDYMTLHYGKIEETGMSTACGTKGIIASITDEVDCPRLEKG